jgi:hypothetical protein
MLTARSDDGVTAKPKGKIVVGLVAAVLALATVLAADPAMAVSAGISPNATLPSGSSRTIVAVWGTYGPFKVNFQCGLAGCANFVTSSTSSSSLSRTVGLATCTGYTANHSLTIWENSGSGASAGASSHTTWTKGNVC